MSRRAGTALMSARCPQGRDIQKGLELPGKDSGKAFDASRGDSDGCKKKGRGEDVGLGQKWLFGVWSVGLRSWTHQGKV